MIIWLFSLLTPLQGTTDKLDAWLTKTLKENKVVAGFWDKCEAGKWRDSIVRDKLLGVSMPKTEMIQLKLAVGRQLARHQLADEAVTILQPLSPSEVVDPAALHFFRGGALQAIGKNRAAVTEMSALVQLPGVPKRYLRTAKLIQDDLKSLDPESLAGISHDMREIHRRLEVSKPDQRTQEIQKDVIARLDKLIKDLEKQAKESQTGGGSRPNKPADKSAPLPEKGKGIVADGKQFRDFSKWGDLPPKEREKVLQNLGKDLPVHYRAAVESYFRKLAEESGGDAP